MRKILVVDAFEHDADELERINLRQVDLFFEKLEEMGIIIKNAKIFHGTTKPAEKSAEVIACHIPKMKDHNLVSKYEIRKSFSREDCESLIELFGRQKYIIIVTDGYAGKVEGLISEHYDIERHINKVDDGIYRKANIPKRTFAMVVIQLFDRYSTLESYAKDVKEDW